MYIGNVGNIQRGDGAALDTNGCMCIGNVGNIQQTDESIIKWKVDSSD